MPPTRAFPFWIRSAAPALIAVLTSGMAAAYAGAPAAVQKTPTLLAPVGQVQTVAPPRVEAPLPQSRKSVVPFRPLDPEGLRQAKLRAAEVYQESTASARAPVALQPAPLAGLVINQPGIAATDELGCCTPPDTTGAIGPLHYVEAVNAQVAVFDRTLTPLAALDLASFIGAPGGNAFDPQIQWDAQANRWLYAADLVLAPGITFLALGWSMTDDPSDLVLGWCTFAAATMVQFNDYPKLGHDDNFLLIGTNVFNDLTGAFETSNIWAVVKPPAGDTSCTPPMAFFFANAANPLLNQDGTLAFTPVPANTTDSSPVGYVVAAHRPIGGGAQTKVMVWHMQKNADGTPSLVADGDLTVTSFAFPASVPQPGSAFLLDSLDARLTQAVAHRDPDAGNAEAIWTQHTIAGPGGRSVERWYEIRTAPVAVRQQGQVLSGTDFIFNGAISPSVSGNDAVIFYNRGSASLLPVIGAQSRRSVTPLGQMDPGEVMLGSSVDPDQETGFAGNCMSQPCRWGDYSGASPDPSNAGVVWGSNQLSGPFNGGLGQWTTQIFAVDTTP